MANPGDFAYTVKQQADIVRIVGDYVKLKKAGAQNYSGLCPFHQEKTASFSVHATRQFYHCFGCGASGDVFSFIQKIENITFPEAVRLVAQKLGIPLPKASYATAGEAKEARQRAQLLQVHERAVEFFQECLRRPEGARAREYLKGRGLDDEIIARFRIGYAPDSGFLLRDRLKDEFSEEALRESGLFSWKEAVSSEPRAASPERDTANPSPSSVIPSEAGSLASERSTTVEGPALVTGRDPQSAAGNDNTAGDRDSSKLRTQDSGLTTRDSRLAMYSKFRNRVMFPIANEAGKVIAFTGRTLSTDEKAGPKYLNSPETPIYSKSRVLFNLDLAKEWIRKFDYAILVEGQMDCISVYAAGFHNVIASSGTAFTEMQAKLLGRFSKNVVVNFDPDTAGAKASERTLDTIIGDSKVLAGFSTSATAGRLIEEEFQIKVVTLEPGFDPDLFIRRKGKDAYREALLNAQKYFDYLIERARTQFPVRSAEGKHKAVQYLLPHIQRVPSRIVRDELAQEIAQKLEINSPVLRQELRHVAVTRSAATVKAPAEAQVTDAERILIRALASARQIQPEHIGMEPDQTGPNEGRLSLRNGAGYTKEAEFDPARQAAFVLQSEGLHRGLATESLAESLLNAGPEVADVMEVPATEADRRTLAAILLKEEDDLTPDLLDSAVRALRKIMLDRRRQEIGRTLEKPGNLDRSQQIALAQERLRMKLAKRSPDSRVELLPESGPPKSAAS